MHDQISYNNERSGILIFCFESSSLSNQKIVKRLDDGHLGGLMIRHNPLN